MEKAKRIGVGSQGRRVEHKSGRGGRWWKKQTEEESGARGAGYTIKAGGGVRTKKHIGTQIVDADGKSKRNRYQGGPVVKYIPRKKYIRRKKHIGKKIVDADGKSKRKRSRYQGAPVTQ